jgi:predicted ATP-binding protein involved in virulence
MAKIHSLSIKDIGPIRQLDLRFDNHCNVICGQNGIGKSTILDVLGVFFANGTSYLKKRADADTQGEATATVSDHHIEGQYNAFASFSDTFPYIPGGNHFGELGKFADRVIVFKSFRDFVYEGVNEIRSDPAVHSFEMQELVLRGIDFSGIKRWLINRFMWIEHEGALSRNQKLNYSLAKTFFNTLDPSIEFDKVTTTHDVIVKTNDGNIPFEWLSSGFKSCLAVLLGMVKEIEWRTPKSGSHIFAGGFDGIIIIDEIDLHLHPVWQAKLYSTLKSTFPEAQIFVSTHSPHVVQVADPREIIALQRHYGEVVINQKIRESEFGCQGWTLEEILSDVMGMEDTRSGNYQDLVASFNHALEDENFQKADASFQVLDKMLHPSNVLRQILKVQLAGIADHD